MLKVVCATGLLLSSSTGVFAASELTTMVDCWLNSARLSEGSKKDVPKLANNACAAEIAAATEANGKSVVIGALNILHDDYLAGRGSVTGDIPATAKHKRAR